METSLDSTRQCSDVPDAGVPNIPVIHGEGIWASHFTTIVFTKAIAVALSFFLQREADWRRELGAESKDRRRTEEKSCYEAVAREQVESELRQSEDRMQMAIEAARMGVFS